MRIKSIEVFYVVLPLIYPWRTAYGEDADIHTVLVRMTSEGHIGWGEASPLATPTYSPETAASVFYLVRDVFAHALVGQDIRSAKELLDRLRHFKGNQFAKAALESAWWVLQANTALSPLHGLLGGGNRNVDAGADFGVQDSYDMLLEGIQAAVDQGFKRVKLKVRPGWDLEMLRLVRSSFPKLVMHIDCNAGYSLADLPFFRACDAMDLAMIEQPLSDTDLHDHAKLQKQIQTPICLDESVKSVRDFELALQLGSCKVLNIKYGRVGGLSVALQLHNLARNAGVPCWVGGMLESAVGAGISIELATLPNFTYPNDIFESGRFYREDLTEPCTHLNSDCTFSPSSVPGIPYAVVDERLARFTRKKTMIQEGRLREEDASADRGG